MAHYAPVNSGYCALSSSWFLQPVHFAVCTGVYAPGKQVLRWENRYKTINTNKQKVYRRFETDLFQGAVVPLKYWWEG